MDEFGAAQGAGLHMVNDCLIVPVAAGLDEDGLERLKKEILNQLKTTSPRGVLINVSSVAILGSFGFSILRDTARAVEMMGGRTVFVGFQPGVAAALVDFGTDLEGILTAVTVQDAFDLLAGQPEGIAPEEENSPEDDSEGDDGTCI